MVDNKNFQMAVLVSILAHSIFFLGLPRMPFSPSKRALRDVKITYYRLKEPEKKQAKKVEIVKKKAEPIVTKLPDIKKEEILKPPKATPKKSEETKVRRKRPAAAIKQAKKKRFEAVVEEEQDNVRKATYINYYRAVREKIRRYADRNYPRNRSLRQGEVFLSFVVTSGGELIQVKVIDGKSISDSLLRNIAINSIRDAAPFPPFPKGMRQYQITFNVAISFELNR